jgi:hypothetical protein
MYRHMHFHLSVDAAGVTLVPRIRGVLPRLLSRPPDLTAADPGDTALALALGDLAALREDDPDAVTIAADRIWLAHRAVAALDGRSAAALGLPPLPDLTFATDVDGIVGSPGFRLRYRWLRNGAAEPVARTGAILHTGTGDCRIPLAILRAIELADAGLTGGNEADWNALARFRAALLGADADAAGRIATSDFLSGLEVHLASGFSMDPRAGQNGLDFEIRAHQGQETGAPEVGADAASVSARIRERGALPAYRLGRGSFLVVDTAARPVLDVMTRMQRASADERDRFVRNPLAAITEAVEEDLRRLGRLPDDAEADYQREIEAATAAFIEPAGYAERVKGIGTFVRPDLGPWTTSGITWLPELFGEQLSGKLAEMDIAALEALRDRTAAAVQSGRDRVDLDGETVRVDRYAIAALDAEIAGRRRQETENAGTGEAQGFRQDQNRPEAERQILIPRENYDTQEYAAPVRQRDPNSVADLPRSLRTPLHPHQQDGLAWSQEAWRSGLPGILNADEQGLGKTLQTISFLAWMKERLAEGAGPAKGPVLVVAPTSLLETWENEVNRHLEQPGLGALIRLYGAGLAALRRGPVGPDNAGVEQQLDLSPLHTALAEGRAHRMWMLTTYQTMTNYQIPLGCIPFSAIVFDEIQALKNPGTLAAGAAKAMNGDFRIGLTGTPVENAVTDLWAILDQLYPGYLGTLKAFRDQYGRTPPDSSALSELQGRIFQPQGSTPSIGLRRLKATAAAHLPEKARYLHPGKMPPVQATAYESARTALAQGGLGGMLKMLHRIRGVSLHPDPGMADGFEIASARLTAALGILDRISSQSERALVFIEDRRMQHRLVALARARYGLERIDIINGSTPIRQRQAIVDRFQSLAGTTQFAILVLGPRAAGTGLTLTAATHVVHLSRWWNPAVEEQCNDRVHRIGQAHPVSIHVPLALHPRYGLGSFDCQLQLLMERKRQLAKETLAPAGETDEDVRALHASLTEEHGDHDEDTAGIVRALFEAMQRPAPQARDDGSFRL